MREVIFALVSFVSGALVGLFGDYITTPQLLKQCPGEPISMVIDKDGTILCTYTTVSNAFKTTKEKKNAARN